MIIVRLWIAAALFAVGLQSDAFALEPHERLADPALEARARTLSAGLRCVVCQNQSIDDSDAGLARDLRRVVREQLQKGLGDDEVKAYLVARYGDFVLLKPPFNSNTLLLWLAPAVLLSGGLLLAFRTISQKAEPAKIDRLTPDEEKALRRLLTEKDTQSD